MNDLNALQPPFWSRANPIDLRGDASAERSGRVLESASGQKICTTGETLQDTIFHSPVNGCRRLMQETNVENLAARSTKTCQKPTIRQDPVTA